MTPSVALALKIGEAAWRDAGGPDGAEAMFARLRDSWTPTAGMEDWAITLACCFGRWCASGFPRVVVGHRHAAALMCTSMAPDLVPELRAPWEAFLLDVPAGVLPFPLKSLTPRARGAAHVAHAFVVVAPAACRVFALAPNLEDAIDDIVGDRLASLLADTADEPPALRLLARFVVGVVAELTEHRAAQASGRGATSVRRARDGAPVTRTFTLARPVTVDCRDAVREFVAGRRPGAPSVQTLVRGHWKRQPCGRAKEGRRWIFVEPYWRGPEDAPLPLRPHVLRPDRDGAA